MEWDALQHMDSYEGQVSGTVEVFGPQEVNDNNLPDEDIHGHDPGTAFEDLSATTVSPTQERNRKIRLFKLEASWDFISKVAESSLEATNYALQLLASDGVDYC